MTCHYKMTYLWAGKRVEHSGMHVFLGTVVSLGNLMFCSMWSTKHTVLPEQNGPLPNIIPSSSHSSLWIFFFLGDRSSVIKNIISFLGKIFEPGLSLGSFFLSPKSHESSQWLLENVILEMLLVCSGKQCRFQAVLIKGCALRRKAAYHNCSMTGVHAACPCFKAFKCFRAK